jgi:hypothetical protein
LFTDAIDAPCAVPGAGFAAGDGGLRIHSHHEDF